MPVEDQKYGGTMQTVVQQVQLPKPEYKLSVSAKNQYNQTGRKISIGRIVPSWSVSVMHEILTRMV
jgi:hypothetical protein